MEADPINRSRETIMGLPPKFRNVAYWANPDDGFANEIMWMQTFRHDVYTFVVMFGTTSVTTGSLYRLSVLRFADGSFYLPKMHHTVAVELPQGAKPSVFEVAPPRDTTAWVMLRAGDQTYIYPINTQAIYIEKCRMIRGNVLVEGKGVVSYLEPVSIVPSAKTMCLYCVGMADGILYMMEETPSGFEFTSMGVGVKGSVRAALGDGLVAVDGREWATFRRARLRMEVGSRGRFPEDILDIRVFTTPTHASAALALTSDGERKRVFVGLGKETVEIDIRGETPTAIAMAADGTAYIGTSAGCVHQMAVYSPRAPLLSMRFAYRGCSDVTAVCPSAGGRVFSAVDGVLYQTDRAVEQQTYRTLLVFLAKFLAVCFLIYCTLFMGI